MKKNMFLVLALVIVAMILSTVAVSAELENSAVVQVSLINQDPDPARVGDIVEVRLGVENLGGADVTDLKIEFVPTYPFSLVSGEESVQNIGSMSGYQGSTYDTRNMKIIKYKLLVDKEISAGTYDFNIKVSYAERISPIESSLSLDVESKQNAEIIHIDKTVLVPGEQSGLKFSINNVGSSPLRDLTFYWENTDETILPVGSDNTRYVKYIAVGKSADLEYQVIADTNADPGLYKLNLYLSYDDSLTNSTRIISTIAGVYVGGETDFDVAFSESSSGQISFTVANIGSNAASSVSVIVPQQSGWQVTGASSMIIGNLNVGDYTVASFTLTQSSSAMQPSANFTPGAQNQRINRTQSSSSNNLKIQIAYTDTMGNRKTVDKEIALNQQSSATGTTTGTVSTIGMPQFGRARQQQNFFVQYKWYIVAFVGLVVVVLFVIFRVRYKKEKLLNPDYNFNDLFKRKEKNIVVNVKRR